MCSQWVDCTGRAFIAIGTSGSPQCIELTHGLFCVWLICMARIAGPAVADADAESRGPC
jgi:hypothetical protein